MRNDKGKIVRKGDLPSKECAYCGRQFIWRKKWERCWDEVHCCSKRCRGDLRRREGGGVESVGDENKEDEAGELRLGGEIGRDGVDGVALGERGIGGMRRKRGETREERWERKAMVKAEKAGKGNDETVGQKACDMCGALRDVLVRCQTDASGKWKMVCTRRCWKSVSGGVPDGDKRFPYYRYGGMWKNHHKPEVTAKMPKRRV